MPSMPTVQPSTATRSAGLALSTEWVDSTIVRISASGEIDASNTAELLDYVMRRGANCKSLILDLKDVTFFGTAGFSALQTIGGRSSRASVSWMVVAGPAVSRLLKICDPRGEIPRGIE
jgi:anti-anti-sigma factor